MDRTRLPLAAAFALFAALPLACSGSKDDGIVPKDDADADTDTDADSDSDADTDTDTDTEALCGLVSFGSDVYVLDSSMDLAAEVAAAPAGATLALTAGTYTVTGPIRIERPLTILSENRARDTVVIDGGRSPGNLVEIASSDVTLAHLTLTGSAGDLVQAQPTTATLTGLVLHDVHLLDAGEAAVRVSGDAADHWVDEGTLSCSLIELTNAGRDYLAAACPATGLDAEGARGWTVRDNRFEGIWCDSGTPQPTVRFTRGSRDTVITRNVLHDVSYGIVVGETQDQIGRTYPDAEPLCGPTVLQSISAVVTNNVIAAYDIDLIESLPGVVTGIRAESSCDASVVHNSVYARPEALPESSIELTFETTTGIFANNLMSHTFRRLAGALADEANNVENADPSSWYFPADGDFHTAPAASWAIDQGSADYLELVPVDMDNLPRSDGTPDIGADEL